MSSDESEGVDSTTYVGDSMLETDHEYSRITVFAWVASGNNDHHCDHGFDADCSVSPIHEGSKPVAVYHCEDSLAGLADAVTNGYIYAIKEV